MGQRFFESTAPRIATELERLNDTLRELVNLLRQLGQTEEASNDKN